MPHQGHTAQAGTLVLPLVFQYGPRRPQPGNAIAELLSLLLRQCEQSHRFFVSKAALFITSLCILYSLFIYYSQETTAFISQTIARKTICACKALSNTIQYDWNKQPTLKHVLCQAVAKHKCLELSGNAKATSLR